MNCFWCYVNQHELSLSQLSSTDIFDFTDDQRKHDKGFNLLNWILLAVRYYFAYLQKQEQITFNPTLDVSLQGSIYSVPNDLLEKAELGALHKSYEIQDECTHRNKVMLGLLV